MQWLGHIVIFLKLVFLLSAFLKFVSKKDRPRLDLELKIVHMLYYNTALFLIIYWFNPWRKKVCLEGEEILIVFTFVLLEFYQEMFPKLF